MKGSFDRISLLFEKCEPSEREKRFDRLHNLFDLKDDEKWVFKSFATFMKLHGWEQPTGIDNHYVNRPKRRNPPCAAPPLSSFPMGKKLDTTQRGAPHGGFLLLSLFIF